MATTFVEYTGDGNATKQFTFPSYQESDVKVRVDGVLKTTSTHYNITGYTTTGGGNVVFTSGNIPSSPAKIRIYRDTNVESPKHTYTAGASVKAGDLNNNQTQLLYRAQEEQVPNLIHSWDIADQAIETSDIKDGAVTTVKIADSNVTTAKIADSNVTTAKIADNAVTMAKLNSGALPTDITVASANIVDGTIVEADIANSAVTQNKLANNSVGTPELINGSVTTDKIVADNVTMDKLGSGALPTDITVASANIVNGTITTADIGGDQITNALIADNQIDSEHYVDGSIDHVHLANDIIDGDNIQDDVVNSEHIAAGALDNEHYAAGSITSDKLNGATVITASEQGSATTNDTSFLTSAAADARFFNISSGDTIKDGQSFPDNDTTIATTAAINDRIIDLVDDVGGFVPIANETSFPTANPDINNPPAGGTIVSIKTISSTRTPSSGTVTIANGAGTGNTVTITGCGSTVLTAGFGVLVETTSTLHTYAFHRLVPKATEVTTVAGISSNITTVANNTANINAVAADASDIGIVAADGTDIGLVAGSIANVNTTAGSIANVNTTAGSISNVNNVGNNISNVNAVAGNASNINSAVSNASNINSAVSNASNINTVAGSISNVNTTATNISSVNNVSSNISNVNNFNDKYQIAANNPTTDGGGNALAAGDLYFNTSANELKVYNGGAWQGGVTATGNFALTTGNTFTGNNTFTAHTTHNDNVKALFGTGSDLEIYHDGSNNSRLLNNTGALNIGTVSNEIWFSKGTSEYMTRMITDGAVELYYDNVKKIGTEADGVSLFGSDSNNYSTIGRLKATNSTVNVSYIDFRTAANSTSGDIVFYTKNSGTISEKLYISHDGIIRVPDNVKYVAGTGNDLQIYHNGSHSFIKNTTGDLVVPTQEFRITNAADTENLAKFIENGAVELYYDNSKKLETTSTGIATDNVRMGAFSFPRTQVGGADFLNFGHGGSFGELDCLTGMMRIKAGEIQLANRFGNVEMLTCNSFGSVEAFHNGSKKLETQANGVTVQGSVFALGTTPQLRLNSDTNDGSTTRAMLGMATTAHNFANNSEVNDVILNCPKDFIISHGSTESMAKFRDDLSVELYFDGSKKFETTSTGIKLMSGGQGLDEMLRLDAGGNSQGHGSKIAFSRAGTLRAEIQAVKVETAHNETDIVFKTTKSGSLFEALRIVGDTGHVQIPADNKKLLLGAGQDLELYHDGASNSRIQNNTGALNINTASNEIWFSKGTSEYMARMIVDGAVELYYDNSKKLETRSNGITVTGYTYSDGVTIGNGTSEKYLAGDSNQLQMYHTGSSGNGYINNSQGTLLIGGPVVSFTNQANNAFLIRAVDGGTAELYHNGSKKFETTSYGALLSGNLQVNAVYPSADSSYDIGTNSTRFANGYFDTLYGDGSNLSGIAAFPSGTVMLFNQSSAPTGWTKSTAHNNKALRVVSGNTSSGGGNGFTTAFNSSFATSGGSVSNHTLTVSQIPGHNHGIQQKSIGAGCGSNIPQTGAVGTFGCNNNSTGINTFNTGGGSSHGHGFTNPSLNLNVAYIDVIVASKN